MKRIYTLIFLLSIIASGFAQSERITLSYDKGKSLKIYDGSQLMEAIEDAMPNDTLFFTAGHFNLNVLQELNPGRKLINKPLAFVGVGSDSYEGTVFDCCDVYIMIDSNDYQENRNVSFDGLIIMNKVRVASNLHELTFRNTAFKLANPEEFEGYESPQLESLNVEGCEVWILEFGDQIIRRADIRNTLIRNWVSGSCKDGVSSTNLNHCNIRNIDDSFSGIVSNSLVSACGTNENTFLNNCGLESYAYLNASSRDDSCILIPNSIDDYFDDATSLGLCADGTEFGIHGGDAPFSVYSSCPTPDPQKSDIDFDAINKKVTIKLEGNYTPDGSPKGFRSLLNNKIVDHGAVPNSNNFELDAKFPDNISLGSINERSYKYLLGDDVLRQTAAGTMTYGVQLINDKNNWGAPLFKEVSQQTVTTYSPETINIPESYSFKKVDIDGLKVYKIKNTYSDRFYIKTSQDCSVSVYAIYEGNVDTNLAQTSGNLIQKGEIVQFYGWQNCDLLVVFYDTPINSANPDDEINFEIMLENNKIATPVVRLNPDNWEVTMECADPRAAIHYTVDGSRPTMSSPVYNQPFVLDKFTRIRAFASYGDYANSDEVDYQYGEANLRIPMPELKYTGGAGRNEFVLTNKIDGVTTYYVVGDLDVEDESVRKVFDGTPFVLQEEDLISAYSVKANLATSDKMSRSVYFSDFITSNPGFGGSSSEGRETESLEDDKEKMYINREGDTYYRILPGKQPAPIEADFLSEGWRLYDDPDNTQVEEGWLVLPGGSLSGNQTVQVYSKNGDKARSEIVNIYTDFVRAKNPKVEYDNYQLKLSTDMPGGKIKYWDNYDYDRMVTYIPDSLPNGIDVRDLWVVSYRVEAEGYAPSDEFNFYRDNYNLPQPSVSLDQDGYIHISHDDESVDLVTEIVPQQQLEEVSKNHFRFIPEYNTEVRAYASKKGFNDSNVSEKLPLSKPEINIDRENFYIWGFGYDTYYTTDGSKPTRESTYNDGEWHSVNGKGIVRAVIFADNEIPGEASVEILDMVKTPEVKFNFKRTEVTETNEYGSETKKTVDVKKVKLACATPGAKINYKFNTTPQWAVYDAVSNPDGLDVTDITYIDLYAEAEGYRQSDQTRQYMNEAYLNMPNIVYKDGVVEIWHDNLAVNIVPTFDPPLDYSYVHNESTNKVTCTVPYGTQVSAHVELDGYVDSDENWYGTLNKPLIYVNNYRVEIDTRGVDCYYTTDGSLPTRESTKYSEPFETSPCTIRAVSFWYDEIPNEADPATVYRKVNTPVASYDGRYLTLASEEGAQIRYVRGDYSDSEVFDYGWDASGKIDLQGCNLIKAIARHASLNESDVFSFTPDYYANETDAYLTNPGNLEKAYGWCDDLGSLKSIKVHGAILGDDANDNGSYKFLRSLPALRHLDLSDVTDVMVPGDALNTRSLRSVVFPATLQNVGDSIFGSYNTTICSVELPGNGFVPANLLDGVKNPNLLLYVKNKNLATDILASEDCVVKNVVVLGASNSANRADNIDLIYAYPFCAHKDFNAQKISMTRAFSKQTPIDGFGAGWETMVVPFDVQTITSAGRSLRPFSWANMEEGECPFWLYRPADTNWDIDWSLMANTPYLIAMPNNPEYDDMYNVSGDVVFSAGNVSVAATPEEENMTYAFGAGCYITGNYDTISGDEGLLAINQNPFTYHNVDFQPGGIFAIEDRDIDPFECYVTANGVRALPVFDHSDADMLRDQFGLNVWSESYDICIRSGIGMNVRIFDTVGQLVRSVSVRPGETVRVQDMTPGIYFVGKTKILVKK